MALRYPKAKITSKDDKVRLTQEIRACISTYQSCIDGRMVIKMEDLQDLSGIEEGNKTILRQLKQETGNEKLGFNLGADCELGLHYHGHYGLETDSRGML